MSNPIQVRIRGTEEVREWWLKAKGEFDVTYARLAVELCKFALSRKEEFRRQLKSGERSHDSEDRTEGR